MIIRMPVPKSLATQPKSTGACNMASGDAKDGKEIPPGTKVVCITCFDEKIEGEVLAFDYGTKVLIISILFA
ncbi:LSM12-like protein A [Acropora cervicornis]|uniref:LSM12-like protein A n=1 Tax=Acropora cervicornis TaxID=6130 RepID=A0AAD9QH93_ACRCE|nr:LSM12-like protein A [Acropora cervicornis]